MGVDFLRPLTRTTTIPFHSLRGARTQQVAATGPASSPRSSALSVPRKRTGVYQSWVPRNVWTWSMEEQQNDPDRQCRKFTANCTTCWHGVPLLHPHAHLEEKVQHGPRLCLRLALSISLSILRLGFLKLFPQQHLTWLAIWAIHYILLLQSQPWIS